jgi:hypothetical protein
LREFFHEPFTEIPAEGWKNVSEVKIDNHVISTAFSALDNCPYD